MFHVYIHAILKACLFMGVGALIHARNDQRIEAVRGRVVDSPGRCSVIIIRCAALSGIPFLCGWFSKDMILKGELKYQF